MLAWASHPSAFILKHPLSLYVCGLFTVSRKETKQDPLRIQEEENAAANAQVDPEADDLFDDF